MTDDSWLDTMHEQSERLMEHSRYLYQKAGALEEIGMDRLAEDLVEVARELRENATAISKATHAKVTDDLHQVEEASGNVFRAVLAGMGALEEKDVKSLPPGSPERKKTCSGGQCR